MGREEKGPSGKIRGTGHRSGLLMRPRPMLSRVDRRFREPRAAGDVSSEVGMKELRMKNEALIVAGEQLRDKAENLIRSLRAAELERQRYVDFFERSLDAQLITDQQGTIQEGNPAASRLLAVDRRFLPGKPLVAFARNEDSRLLYQALDVLRRERTVDLELTFVSRKAKATRVALRGARMSEELLYVWFASPTEPAD